MSFTGGKRKVNKSLKAWVAFVKKVQKEEKLSYKDAIHRAKVRKDKGEKWMTVGGMNPRQSIASNSMFGGDDMDMDKQNMDMDMDMDKQNMDMDNSNMMGGRRRAMRRTMRRGRSRGRARSMRRGRSRASRRY